MIASCLGTVLPFAYFVLEAGTSGAFQSMEQSPTTNLQAIPSEIPNLKPLLYFTDNEDS